MSTSSDPQRGGQQPDQGPYGGPPQYGGPPGQPGQYGQQPGQYGGQPYPGQPYPGQPYGGQPYTGDKGAYAYNPYGTPYPSAPDDAGMAPVSRPGIMILSLVLLILSTLPFLLAGSVFLIIKLDGGVLPAGFDLDGQLARAGLTLDTFLNAVRVVGAVMVGLAVLYVLFAVFAFLGRSWARILLTVMTVGFTLLLLAGVVLGGARDATSMVFVLLVLLASVGGTAILFMPDSRRYFTGA